MEKYSLAGNLFDYGELLCERGPETQGKALIAVKTRKGDHQARGRRAFGQRNRRGMQYKPLHNIQSHKKYPAENRKLEQN